MSEPSSQLLSQQLELAHLSSMALPVEGAELLAGKNNQYSIKQNGIWLHSRHNPKREAERQLEGITIGSDQQVLFVFGCGLAYLLELFWQKNRNPVVWVEPDTEILLWALALLDFRHWLKNGRLKIISRIPDKSKRVLIEDSLLIAEDILQDLCKGRSNQDIVFYKHRASFRADTRYSILANNVEDWLNRKAVNLATMERFDRLWAHNIIRNLPDLMQARPVSLLFQAFDKCEVILCAAGPSLAQDAEQIKHFRSGRILICVDTALHVLLNIGITPDIVMAVDPQGVNQYYLENFNRDVLQNTAFVIDPCVVYMALRHLSHSQLFYFNSPFSLFQLIATAAEDDIGELAFGGSVSTNAYDLAIKLGARTILMFGQDLAFSNDRAHSPGATLEEQLAFKEDYFYSREAHNYRQMYALPRRYLSDVNNKNTVRNDKLLIFHQWFEKRFSKDIQAGIKIYDLKTAGAPFVALQKQDLSKLEQKPIKAAQFTLRDFDTSKTIDPKRFASNLNDLLQDLSSLVDFCQEGLILAEQNLQWALDDKLNESYFQNLRELDKLDQKISQSNSSSRIAGEAIQKIIYQITESVSKPQDSDESKHGVNARQSVALYQGLQKAAEEIRKWLLKTQSILAKQADSWQI